jgi:hypothetical protein
MVDCHGEMYRPSKHVAEKTSAKLNLDPGKGTWVFRTVSRGRKKSRIVGKIVVELFLLLMEEFAGIGTW